MKKAFTLIELMVAVGILAMVLAFASLIFRSSIDSYRTASANAEIMRKLRAITDQLNADFKGLRKDGEIFVVWVTHAKNGSDKTDPNSYERFDRIMFFADGDFQSYGTIPKIIRGNVARISYMLAKRGNITGQRPVEDQLAEKRILARTQHILTADNDPNLIDIFDPNKFTGTNEQWYYWNNRYEYDKISSPDANLCLEGWKNIPWELSTPDKQDILSVIADVDVFLSTIPYNWTCRGATVNPADPNSIHMLLCEGVGEFKVQGWYDAQKRWVPEVDPDGDGQLTDDTDFFLHPTEPILDPNRVPGALYPYRGILNPNYGFVFLRTISYDPNFLNEANFNSIPGLGRALKFTFTLYDSKGVIKNGRTFTHIVYLD